MAAAATGGDHTATSGLDEEGVRRLLQGRRFHKLQDPNPKSVTDVTSTWTIPSAGKDELVFHADGTYVFNGEVSFVGGHQLFRSGRGQWLLRRTEVRSGEWVALRLAQVAEKKGRTLGCDPAEYVGRALWQVVIAGPNLTQEGEAMDMDDVAECGVLTEFATDADGGGGDDDDDDDDDDDNDMPSLASSADVGATDTPTPGVGECRKRIRSMSWWVDDVLTWTAEEWLSPDESRKREHRLRNPLYSGLGRGFLLNNTSPSGVPIPASAADASAAAASIQFRKFDEDNGSSTVAGGGTARQRRGGANAGDKSSSSPPSATTAGPFAAAAAAAAALGSSSHSSPAGAPSKKNNEDQSNTILRGVTRHDRDKPLPPLVPKRADIETSADRPPPPPHTFCGKRVEDLALVGLSAFFFLFVIAYVQRQ
jgi:hypothetical protein